MSSAVASKCRVNISFSGCGFLGMYHVGSVARFKDGQASNEDNFEINSALGASAGSLAATALILDLPPSLLRSKMHEIAGKVKSLGFLGPFHPTFDVVDLFQKELDLILPPDAHVRASGKLHISLTDGTMNNVIVSQFASNTELKEALICSCYLPAFSSWKQVPSYQGKAYLDGGFSNNQPVLAPKSTIRVSPFAGGSHICPSDDHDSSSSSRPFLSKWGGEVINLTSTNMKRLYEAMMPPDDLDSLFKLGYEHTEAFLSSDKFQAFLNDIKADED